MVDVVLTHQAVWLVSGVIATCLLHAALRYLRQFSTRLVTPQESGGAEPGCTMPPRPVRFPAKQSRPLQAVPDAPSH